MTAKPETAAEVLAEMRRDTLSEAYTYTAEIEKYIDRLERALSAQGEAVAWRVEEKAPWMANAGWAYTSNPGDVTPAHQPLYTHPAPVRVTEEMVERALAQWFSDQYGRDDGPDSSWLAVQEEFEDGGERFRREMRAALTAALEDRTAAMGDVREELTRYFPSKPKHAGWEMTPHENGEWVLFDDIMKIFCGGQARVIEHDDARKEYPVSYSVEICGYKYASGPYEDGKSRAEFLAAKLNLYTALSARGEVPEGFVLVPREPTPNMIESSTGGQNFRTANCETLGDERDLLRRQWSAMLAAAPQPAGEDDPPRAFPPMPETPFSAPNGMKLFDSMHMHMYALTCADAWAEPAPSAHATINSPPEFPDNCVDSSSPADVEALGKAIFEAHREQYVGTSLWPMRGWDEVEQSTRDHWTKVARRLSCAQQADRESITGELVEIGDDETGQPRIVVHTTREAIRAYPTPLLFRRVTVAAENSPRAEPEMSPAPAMIQSIDSVDVESIALQVANVFAREDDLGVDEQGRAQLQRRIVETIFFRLGDDMVERGAKYLAASAGNMPAWESLGCITKDAFRRQARAALTAALNPEAGR